MKERVSVKKYIVTNIMKKKIILFPLAIVFIGIIIYVLCRPTVAFESMDQGDVTKIAYLTVNNGYQSLPSNEEQRFLGAISNIKIMTIGSISATDATGDGELRDQFCITLADGTQYIIGSLYPYLNIDGKAYRVVGKESEEKVKELEKIFKEQEDHMVCW